MSKKRKNKKFQRIEGYIPETKTLNEKIRVLKLDEIKNIDSIDSRFKRLIIKFVNFLRKEDFIISSDAIIKFFNLYQDFDIFDIDDIKYSLKMLFCKSKEQYMIFEEYFDMFFYGSVDLKNSEYFQDIQKQLADARAMDLLKEKEEKEKEFKEYQSQIELKKQEKINEITKSKEKIEKDKKDFLENFNKNNLTYKRRKEKNEKELKEWAETNKSMLEAFLNECKLTSDEKDLALKMLLLSQDDILELLKDNSDKMIEKLKKILNSIMMDNIITINDPTINNLCLVSSNIVMKTKVYVDKKHKEINSELQKFDDNLQAEVSRLKNIDNVISQEVKKMSKDIEEYDKKINNISKEVEKEIVLKHRNVFIEGKNAVKVNTNMDLLESDIEKLTDSQYDTLTEIIKSNASKFRTKISRAMIKHKNKRFNYKKTMQNSLKTYGVPMELYYEKPKIKKTKIVCILDVSGSCAKSSKLLLRFIYELSNVFKGGVKSYAFVKDLADISDNFVKYHINDAIEESIHSVARTYSDYYTALKTFNDLYLGEVDKNTIVIFLGDARNNKNESGEEYLKNIQRRAKSTIWLNTEEKPKWNVNDSIIDIYSQYMDDVHEILTTNDIIKFLEGFKIK